MSNFFRFMTKTIIMVYVTITIGYRPTVSARV